MTRSEAYNEGFHTGRRWAERDISDHVRVDPEYNLQNAGDAWRATALGHMRGYRDTWARYDAGTLTPEMFELAPRRPGVFDMRRELGRAPTAQEYRDARP